MRLVGRDREVAAVGLLLDRAAAGTGGVLVVYGPPGAGRTALAEAAGDPDKAEEILRKQLKGKMESRTDRAAGEGRIDELASAPTDEKG